MQLTAAHLRYLLAIYEVSRTHLDISSRSIAEKLGVTKPSVVRILNLLMEQGMIVKEYYGKIYLTDRGIWVAKRVQQELDAKSAELGVNFNYADYTFNGQGDSTTLNQIAAQLVDDGVDVVVPIATPAAQVMQSVVTEKGIPIIFAAVSEDAGRRFRDFLGTAKAVRKISDRLCLENGLSVIENPKRGRKDYGKWLGDQRPLSAQEKVRDAIDAALAQRPADFAAFLRLMEAAGFKAQRRGSSLSFLAPGQEKATRCRKKTLGDDYTPEAIQERIEGRRVVSSSRSKAPAKPARKVNLLIDIQSKLQAGKGAGYAQWAKVFNLKQMAQTISFLEENGLLEYDALAARAAEGTARFNELSGTIKRTEGRMAEIAALQKQIVNYSKTRDVYAAYRKAGYSKKFLAAHETEILLHKAAKAAFDKLCLQKLPTYKTLQAEYAGLLAEKKKAYAEYAAAKKEMQAVLTAKANVDRLLGAPPERPEQEKEQAQR